MKWHLNHAKYGNKPWAVQSEAMHRSEGIMKYFYAMEQGLGKTPLTLNDYVEYLMQGVIDLAIVMAPPTFKADWIYAPEEWGVPDIPTHMWEGGKSKTDMAQFEEFIKNETGILSMNYEAGSRSKAQQYIQDVLKERRCMLIIDESSVIKNPASAITQSILDFAKQAVVVRELNGTPQTQNVMDWYAQLRVVGELDGKNRYQFRNRYAVMGGYMSKQVKGAKNQEEMFELIDKVTFRALKKDWRKDLPPQKDQIVRLEMTGTQAKHYKEMMEEFYTAVNGMEVTAELALTRMDKLRQISSCLALQDGEAEWIERPEKNPKVRATLDLMGNSKTIVVYQYRETGRMLYELFKDMGLQPGRIAGTTTMSPEEVRADKKRFNEDPGCRVIVCQQSAACMGHTLLGTKGDRCSKMIFFENSFNLRDRLQMRDRNHRGEQDEPCDYYDLCTSPMDYVYLSNLQDKKADADLVDDVIRCVASREW